MQPQTVWALYFSPTGNAARLAVTLAKSMAEALGAKLRVWDFTLPKNRVQKIVFKKEDLVVVSTPVYAGRVPNKLLPYLENNWQGNGALAIPLVSFGNRAFDDALIELRNLLEADGFHTVAAGAQPSQHAFSALLAPGRPRGCPRARAASPTISCSGVMTSGTGVGIVSAALSSDCNRFPQALRPSSRSTESNSNIVRFITARWIDLVSFENFPFMSPIINDNLS